MVWCVLSCKSKGVPRKYSHHLTSQALIVLNNPLLSPLHIQEIGWRERENVYTGHPHFLL